MEWWERGWTRADDGAQATKRGAPVGGKLSKELAAMPADGGRTEEAIRKGSDKGAPLVVSSVGLGAVEVN